ncbi:MAG: SpoIIE family protein phosphatase [Leptospiraceae bacterium]|nr:SpoIIE family protein phosphatase [Leptospiraceae bacterium]
MKFLLALFLPLFSLLSKEIIINDAFKFGLIGKELEILQDRNSEYIPDTILHGGYSELFSTSNDKIPNLGYSRGIVWTKFSLKNESSHERFFLELDFPPTDEIYFFYRDHEDKIITKSSGDLFPFTEKEFPIRNYIFEIDLKKGETKEFLLKMKTTSMYVLKLNLFSNKKFIEKEETINLLNGIIFGVLITLSFYNFYFYLSLKEKVYLYLCLYTIFITSFLASFNGYSFKYLLPNLPFTANLITLLNFGLALSFSTIFFGEFLELRHPVTKSRKIINTIFWVQIAITLFAFILPYTQEVILLNLVSVLVIVSFVVTSIYLFKKNLMFNKTNFFGFIFIVSLALILVISNFRFIERTFVVVNGLLIGTLFANVFFSILLANKIKILKLEHKHIYHESQKTRERLSYFQNEFESAKKMHRTLLPPVMPKVNGLNMQAMYVPSHGISGDLYDFTKTSYDGLGIIIVDVTGHGFPAAFYASIVKYSFAKAATSFDSEPDQLLYMMNAFLYKKLGNLFLTAGYLFINRNEFYFEYSSCGHPPILFYSKKENLVYFIKPRGRMIGVLPNIEVEKIRQTFEVGDKVFLYTDGLIEATSPEGEEFGEHRVSELILQNHDLPARELTKKLLKVLSNYSGMKKGFEDDITFVAIDIT